MRGEKQDEFHDSKLEGHASLGGGEAVVLLVFAAVKWTCPVVLWGGLARSRKWR